MDLAAAHPEWALGFQDEVWWRWSRVAHPRMHSWAEQDKALRLIEKEVPKGDPDPKALACYGLWLPEPDLGEMLLRFVDARPVSAMTTHYLEWCCRNLWEKGKRVLVLVLVLVWDNAPCPLPPGTSANKFGSGSESTTGRCSTKEEETE